MIYDLCFVTTAWTTNYHYHYPSHRLLHHDYYYCYYYYCWRGDDDFDCDYHNSNDSCDWRDNDGRHDREWNVTMDDAMLHPLKLVCVG